ncbi:MAG: hypothetical protein V7L00_22610 [Nostoc sp.]|uniref:hypothetical protein n=1 Tax=Nostoc sp. TaxID=1180 RepID=UPI002FF88B98
MRIPTFTAIALNHQSKTPQLETRYGVRIGITGNEWGGSLLLIRTVIVTFFLESANGVVRENVGKWLFDDIGLKQAQSKD